VTTSGTGVFLGGANETTQGQGQEARPVQSELTGQEGSCRPKRMVRAIKTLANKIVKEGCEGYLKSAETRRLQNKVTDQDESFGREKPSAARTAYT